MFKLKLMNERVIDVESHRSLSILDDARLPSDSELPNIVTTVTTMSDKTITKVLFSAIKSVISDSGEIDISGLSRKDAFDAIKQKFEEHVSGENDDVPSENPPTTITITFDFDGGQIDGGYGSSEATVDYGTKGLPYKYCPHPTKENYELVGWEPDITGNYEFTKDITVKAIWEKQKTLKLIIDPDTITYGLSAASMSVTDENGDAVSFSELNITNDNEDLVSVNIETGEISAVSVIGGRATITVERDGVSDSAYINVVAPTEENL